MPLKRKLQKAVLACTVHWQEISTASLKMAHQAGWPSLCAFFGDVRPVYGWCVTLKFKTGCIWLSEHFDILLRKCKAVAKCLILSPIFSVYIWLNICEPPLISITIQASGHLRGTSHSFKRIIRVPFTQFESQPSLLVFSPWFLKSLARVLSLWDFVCKDLVQILQIYCFPLALHALCVFASRLREQILQIYKVVEREETFQKKVKVNKIYPMPFRQCRVIFLTISDPRWDQPISDISTCFAPWGLTLMQRTHFMQNIWRKWPKSSIFKIRTAVATMTTSLL